jgi:putative ABC transport system permease protein
MILYFKLALKNVKKSYKDFTLYFLTLTFGVCIFYVFNSIEAQRAMMVISRSANEIMQSLSKLLGIVSIFVSIVLGFLIVYANNFLIRRRKKELGIYMTLGMEKGNVAKVLAAETFIIGLFSLGAGLLLGIFLSQGFSVITAKIFEADMTKFKFIFSYSAFLKTILYFGIIFLVVIFMSTFSISRYKLINLLNAEKQNEVPKMKNPVLTVILFILSIACIGTAYYLVLKNGISRFDKRLLFEVILGAAGTFLFFASLSGFFLKLIQSNKKLYYKELNMFILRQINSRINTTYISMAIICLMLFLTIGILSTGIGINRSLNNSYKSCTPYDASFTSQGKADIYGTFKKYNFDLYKYTDKYIDYSLYQYSKENLTKKLITGKVENYLPKDFKGYLMNSPLLLIKLSDYNKLMKLQGKNEVILNDGQVAVYSDITDAIPEVKDTLNKFINMKYKVEISGKNYDVCGKPLTVPIMTSPSSNIMLALVVPDRMVEGSNVSETVLCFNCKGDSKITQDKLEDDLYAFTDKYKDKKSVITINGATRNMIKAIAAGSTAIISFIGIYLGIIFLLTSSAVLALQQLSEAADNRQRYEILQKIGADEHLINKTLMKQIAIYFMLPLALACVHSVVGIKVANDVISSMGQVNVIVNTLATAAVILIFYGSYFLATYFSSKNLILNNNARY